MEITFSKSRLRWMVVLILMIAATVLVFQNDALKSKFLPQPVTQEEELQPALKAVAAIYAPDGDQKAWEQTVCLNTTPNGCDFFKFYYSASIWKSGVSGGNPHFIEVTETLKDGSQIWQVNITIKARVQPMFILVEKAEDEQWYLARILFEEEVKKYEN